MNPELLIAHFDRISEAPDAVPRLRRFVLDLAVRGKLVEQDRRDEPASELLERIPQEKARIAKGSGITQSFTSPITASEMPFQVPHSWAWVRVGRVFKYDAGTKCSPRELLPDKWLLELEDIEKETSAIETRRKVKDRDSRSTKSEFRAGDILYGKLRPYLNKVVVADEDGYSTTEIVAIRPLIPISSSYGCLAFRRPDFVAYVSRVGQGTKMPRLRTQDALVALFPLPPIAEQHRIVAKVDELMVLCDRLEKIQRERETQRDGLTAASHFQLNNGVSAQDCREHARFYLKNLEQLTITSQQISSLRRTIFDLAVHGQLTCRSDESEEAHVTSSDAKFPAHWSVLPLREIAVAIVDCPHSTPKWTAEGKICVRTNQFRPGKLDLSTSRFVSKSTYIERIQRLEPAEDDILYSREGGILGIACRVPPKTQLCLGQRMMLIRAGSAINAAFLEMVLNSPLITRIALAKTTGGAAPRINVATVKDYPIPIPPLAEQERIVAKVIELIALCEALEARLAVARKISRRLLDAVLQSVLAPARTQPSDFRRDEKALKSSENGDRSSRLKTNSPATSHTP